MSNPRPKTKKKPRRNRELGGRKRKPKEFMIGLTPEQIDYKRLDLLVKFLKPNGKIEGARRTGATRKQQTKVSQAIKRARYLALLPYSRDAGDEQRPSYGRGPRQDRDRDRDR
ncbi:MAG: 30S ribosomal protein S18 [Candidatus Latescibacteria bacterium]|nr:30S ribosomal protein S18 [Candidatus Latescibacterota bacterium]